MSTTGTPTPPAATVNPDAVRFVNDMVSNTQLLQAYATVVDQVAQSADKDPTPINTFLSSHGYNATAPDIGIALLAIQGQQVAYWSGAYTMQSIGQNGSLTPGPWLTINPPTPSGAERIAYGPSWLIEPVFAESQLAWVQKDNQGNALNQTAGSLTFSLALAKDGSTVRACNGNITSADGTAQAVVGAQQGSTPPAGSTPADQDPNVLNWIAGVTGAVVCLATVVAGVITCRTAILERTKIEMEINKMKQEGNQQGADQHAQQANAAEERVNDENAAVNQASIHANNGVEMVRRNEAAHPVENESNPLLMPNPDELATVSLPIPPSAEAEAYLNEVINGDLANQDPDSENLEQDIENSGVNWHGDEDE